MFSQSQWCYTWEPIRPSSLSRLFSCLILVSLPFLLNAQSMSIKVLLPILTDDFHCLISFYAYWFSHKHYWNSHSDFWIYQIILMKFSFRLIVISYLSVCYISEFHDRPLRRWAIEQKYYRWNHWKMKQATISLNSYVSTLVCFRESCTILLSS